MNLRRQKALQGQWDEPEINFIPLIDVLLVVLIFFMATTTFSRFADLQINLPSAQANQPETQPKEIHVAVTSNGQYAIDQSKVTFVDANQFAQELQKIAAGKDDALIVIHADGAATHQAVINVMEAARLAKLNHIAFATQKGK